MSSNDKLRNVGPKSAAWLRQVGIRTQADLETLGAVASFIKVKRAGFRPSLNLLYALEGAILGCHWQEIPDTRRAELVQAAEAEVALLPQPKCKRMPAATPVTTTQMEGSGDEGGMAEGHGDAADLGFDDPGADAGPDGAEGAAED